MSDLIEPLSVNDLLARTVQTFDELLPDGWETSISRATEDPYIDRRIAPDALLKVTAPDGTEAAFAVAAKLTLAGRDAAPLLAKLRRWGDQHATLPLVAARYLSSTVRELLAGAGASFVDAGGNVRVVSMAPAMMISRVGSQRDPWRRPRTRDTLRGEPAARIARALCDFEAPMPTARLIELSGASAGAAYRVLELLFDEGLAAKGERGWIDSVDWPRLLQRWANDWSAAERRFSLSFMLPRGLDDALTQLARQPRDSYVLGGGHAVAQITGRASRHAIVHCEDAAGLADQLGAEPAHGAANAELTVHARGLTTATARSTPKGRPRLAAPSQAFADLMLTENNVAATHLLKAMKTHPSNWRRSA